MSPEVMHRALDTRIPVAWRERLRHAVEGAEAMSECCQGRPGEPCTFAINKKPGKFRMHGRGTHCLLCGPEEALEQALALPNGVQTMVNKLKKMSPDTMRTALDTRIPHTWREELRKLLPLDVPMTWAAILESRHSCNGGFSDYDERQYRKRKLDDRKFAQNQMRLPQERVLPGTEVDNETSLPPAKRFKAAHIQHWA
eukprot:4560943-Karenia_brevis.AAC.1